MLQVLRECLCPAHIIEGQHLVSGEGFGGYERDGVAVCIRVYSLPAHQAYLDGNVIDLRVGQILEVMQCFDHETSYGHIDILALMRFSEELHLLVCRMDGITFAGQIDLRFSAETLDEVALLPVIGLFNECEIVLQI